MPTLKDIVQEIKLRLYKNIIPSGYHTPLKRIWNAVVKNESETTPEYERRFTPLPKEQTRNLTNDINDWDNAFNKDLENDIRNALYAKYLGLTDEQAGFKISDYVQESPYRPPNAKPEDLYYRINPDLYPNINNDNSIVRVIPKTEKVKNPYKGDNKSLHNLFLSDSVAVKTYPKNILDQDITITNLKDLPYGYLGISKGFGMGSYTVGKGVDENGDKYISYYDEWDLNPFRGDSSVVEIPFLNKIRDILPIGAPFKLYDRKYRKGGVINLENARKILNNDTNLPLR